MNNDFDDYEQYWLNKIHNAHTNEELVKIINEIYCDGFDDGHYKEED